jgi:hypothetical protein
MTKRVTDRYIGCQYARVTAIATRRSATASGVPDS